MLKKPYIIGISGESGVGKSTICDIVKLYFHNESVVVLSTDDLHKYERKSKMWDTITHLNPEANNLEMGDIQLESLSNGESIYRSIYNHKTGFFNPPIKINPADIIVIEGLHAFYTSKSQELINLKIFIDTQEDLRIHWKIIRDTECRGYKYNDVLNIIEKRKLDTIKIKDCQLNKSDIVIKISTVDPIKYLGKKNEPIDLKFEVSFKNTIYEDNIINLIDFINNYLIDFYNFINYSERIGSNILLCQNAGGNISIKTKKDFMIIKSSGFEMKEVNQLDGYSIIKYNKFKNYKLENEKDFNEICNNISINDKRPSMELGMHVLLKKYTMHVHPVYLTLILCLENSKEIIHTIYDKNIFNYEYVEFCIPGYDLYIKFKEKQDKNIYFLENHGLVVTHDNIKECEKLLNEICEIAKRFLQTFDLFHEFYIGFSDLCLENKYAFPDAAIFINDLFKKEIHSLHNYINYVGNRIGKIRYIDNDNINIIKNLDAEKYRSLI